MSAVGCNCPPTAGRAECAFRALGASGAVCARQVEAERHRKARYASRNPRERFAKLSRKSRESLARTRRDSAESRERREWRDDERQR